MKYGKWLNVGHDDTTYFYRCSECGHEEHDNMTKHDNYCSSCGAYMQGYSKDVFIYTWYPIKSYSMLINANTQYLVWSTYFQRTRMMFGKDILNDEYIEQEKLSHFMQLPDPPEKTNLYNWRLLSVDPPKKDGWYLMYSGESKCISLLNYTEPADGSMNYWFEVLDLYWMDIPTQPNKGVIYD